MTVPFVAVRALHRRAFKTGMGLYKTTQKPFRPFDQRTEELMLQCQATQEFRTADLRATGSTNFGILMYPKQKTFGSATLFGKAGHHCPATFCLFPHMVQLEDFFRNGMMF